jgi:hypothetical protein
MFKQLARNMEAAASPGIRRRTHGANDVDTTMRCMWTTRIDLSALLALPQSVVLRQSLPEARLECTQVCLCM